MPDMTPPHPGSPRGLALFVLAAALLSPFADARSAATPQQDPPPGFVATYLAEARGKLGEGDLLGARAATERALERDRNSLDALQLLARIGQMQSDLDTAVHSLHRWLDVFDSRNRGKNPPERKVIGQSLVVSPGSNPAGGTVSNPICIQLGL